VRAAARRQADREMIAEMKNKAKRKNAAISMQGRHS
jgi:hypothetical protein